MGRTLLLLLSVLSGNEGHPTGAWGPAGKMPTDQGVSICGAGPNSLIHGPCLTDKVLT